MTAKGEPTGGVDRTHGRSLAQRSAFLALHLASVAVCAWLVLGDGVATAGGWLGFDWAIATRDRGLLLVGVTALYCGRHAVTLFVLLQRRVSWSEALGLGLFLIPLEVGYCLLGCGVAGAHPLGWLDTVAVGLVLVGSYLNTASELQRKRWKAQPENKGRCYTGGLFRHSMHINYFGDVLSFTGWTALTATWWTFPVPLLMTALFVFVHIPGLDAYLARRYGDEFADYAARTKKLVPGIY